MSADYIPDREAQALREAGSTEVRRAVALAAALAFLFTVLAIPLLEPLAERLAASGPSGAGEGSAFFGLFRDFGARAAAAIGQLGSASPRRGNRELLEAIDDFQRRLEEQSVLHRELLPRLQWRLALGLGLASEQAYVGRHLWLFYRPDVDHVTGRGFLRPEVLRARRLAGDPWEPPPQPDPVPTLVDFDAQLRERGIRLLVLPTPVKPSVHPSELAAAAALLDRPLQNVSFAAFIERLTAAGVAVLDPAPALVEQRIATGEPQYLRADTHWTPAAVDRVARELAGELQSRIELGPPPPSGYRRRTVELEGAGDIARMLLLPADRPALSTQRVSLPMVLRADGRGWRPERAAAVLLLGDSFSNIYSDPTLGWGSGAGLAEQLSFHLQRPVDKLALNAGGPLATRRALQRTQAGGEDRLAGKRAVVYQFATRELSTGDWRILKLSPSAR